MAEVLGLVFDIHRLKEKCNHKVASFKCKAAQGPNAFSNERRKLRVHPIFGLARVKCELSCPLVDVRKCRTTARDVGCWQEEPLQNQGLTLNQPLASRPVEDSSAYNLTDPKGMQQSLCAPHGPPLQGKQRPDAGGQASDVRLRRAAPKALKQNDS